MQVKKFRLLMVPGAHEAQGIDSKQTSSQDTGHHDNNGDDDGDNDKS